MTLKIFRMCPLKCIHNDPLANGSNSAVRLNAAGSYCAALVACISRRVWAKPVTSVTRMHPVLSTTMMMMMTVMTMIHAGVIVSPMLSGNDGGNVRCCSSRNAPLPWLPPMAIMVSS